MKQIITDLTFLSAPSTKLEFVDDTGIHKEEGLEIVSQIKEVMEADETILALSAPQIGIRKRIICIRFGKEIKTFINPIIKTKGAQIISFETNASMPNKEIAIKRSKEIDVAYYTDEFKYEDNKFLNSAARVFEQQYQLLDGIIPGRVLNIFNADRQIEAIDVPSIVDAIWSGGGLVVDIETEEDHLTTNNIEVIAEILEGYCQQFKVIGENLRDSQDELTKVVYNNFYKQELIIRGIIKAIEPEGSTIKLNREQRRAAQKDAKRAARKAAGK